MFGIFQNLIDSVFLFTSDVHIYAMCVYRGYIMGGFVYDFYPRVSAANEWQISYPHSWIKIMDTNTPIVITFLLHDKFLKRKFF